MTLQPKNSGESQPEVVIVEKIRFQEIEQTIVKLTKMLLKAGSKLENAIDDNNRLKAIVAEHERLAEEYNNMSDSDIFEEID